MGNMNIQEPNQKDRQDAWKDLIMLIAAFALGYILGGMR